MLLPLLNCPLLVAQWTTEPARHGNGTDLAVTGVRSVFPWQRSRWTVIRLLGEERRREVRGGIKHWCAAAAPAGAGEEQGRSQRDNDVTVGEGGPADYMNTLVSKTPTFLSSYHQFKQQRPPIGWLSGWARGVRGCGGTANQALSPFPTSPRNEYSPFNLTSSPPQGSCGPASFLQSSAERGDGRVSGYSRYK